MRRRDIIKSVPAAVVASGLAACAQPGAIPDKANGRASLTIVHLNDVYEIVPTGDGKSGGLARVATVIKQLKATHPAVLVTLGGLVTIVFVVWFFWLVKKSGTKAALTSSGYQEALILVKGGYTPDTAAWVHQLTGEALPPEVLGTGPALALGLGIGGMSVDRLFAAFGKQPNTADRFASDLFWTDVIADSWLREFTYAAKTARIPVILGGHSLVAGGLYVLAEIIEQQTANAAKPD